MVQALSLPKRSRSPSVTHSALPMRSQSGCPAVSCCVHVSDTTHARLAGHRVCGEQTNCQAIRVAASRATARPSGRLRVERTVGQPRSDEDVAIAIAVDEDAAVVVTARPSRSRWCGHPDAATGPSWPLRGHRDRDHAAIVARPLRRLGRLPGHLSDCVASGPSASRAATTSGREYHLK